MSTSLFLLLIAISGIGPLALNGVLPATSAVMKDYGASFAEVQLVLTVFLGANLVSQLVLGPAADRHGRRPVMLLGLGLFIVGSLGCAMAPSIHWLLVARVVQGFGAAVCVFLPRTIVRDLYGQDQAASVIGYMTTAMMAAPLFGPALGGWITDQVHWHFIYWGFAGLGVCLLLSAWVWQRETLSTHPVTANEAHDAAAASTPDSGPAQASGDHSESRSSLRPIQAGQTALPGQAILQNKRPGFKRLRAAARKNAGDKAREKPMLTLLRTRAYLAYVVMQCGTVGVYYAFLAGAPFVAMESRGVSPAVFGRWFVLVALGYMSGNLLAGRYSVVVGGQRMIQIGLLPFSIGIIGFWLFSNHHHPAALFLPMCLVAFSNGMVLPNLISGAISVRPDLAATASGLAGSLQTGIGVLVSVLLAAILPVSDVWLFVVLTISFAVAVAGLWYQRRLPGAASAQ